MALLLGDGHAPRRIATMVRVTDDTVRSQIKGIFSKAGVRRQGKLIGCFNHFAVGGQRRLRNSRLTIERVWTRRRYNLPARPIKFSTAGPCRELAQ